MLLKNVIRAQTFLKKYSLFIHDDIKTLISFSKFHNELKKANVVPGHKRKSKFSKENYRSISILPNTCKVYRRCFLKVSTRLSQGLQCTPLPVSYDRKIGKNSGLWRCLWCIINRPI